MDVKKTKVAKRKMSPKPVIAIIVVALLAVMTWYVSSQAGIASVKRDDLLLSTVKKGDLQVEINGFGVLRSDKQLLISALTNATVQEIVLKPGAIVTKDSVIVVLANPELQQQVDNASQELAQRKANLRQLKLNQQRELLNESARFAEMEASYATAKVRFEAQTDLVKEGIVSALDYKESQVNVTQLEKRIVIHKQRTEALKLVNQEAISIQLEQIKQQQGQLEIAQNRLERLTVKADFDGVLQRLSVELGQSLSAGQEIALIGSVDELVALIKVPQNAAQQIEIGQQTIVDTRRDKIQGKVTRIDPVVVDNSVEVEVSLPTELPSSARPQLNVDAVIVTDVLTNIAYIDRPANIRSYTSSHLFLVNDSVNKAVRTKVEFGQEAGRYIQVLEGASVDQRLIVSDLTQIKSSQLSIEAF